MSFHSDVGMVFERIVFEKTVSGPPETVVPGMSMEAPVPRPCDNLGQ
jgi:hypothetical protein